MKKNSFLPLIWLCLLLIGISCSDKEPKIIPAYWQIEEFAIDKNIKAELIHNSSNNPTGNEIILTLPSNYTHDYIIPTIKAKYAVTIYPKPAVQLIYENKWPMTYRFTDKNGKWIEYKLYVRRNDVLKASTPSQEFQLEKVQGQFLTIALQNVGTIDNSVVYEALFYDATGNQKYSVLGNSMDSQLAVLIPFPQYFISGNYQVKIRMVKRSEPNKILRDSEPISINFLKSKASTIVNLNPRLLQEQSYTIRGYGFNASKKYTLRLKNDFMNSDIDLTGQYIDETQINFSLPVNLEEVDYEGSFLEDGIKKDVWLPNSTLFLHRESNVKSLVALFTVKDKFDFSYLTTSKSSFNRGENINTPYFNTNRNNVFNLIMTNLNSGEEFKLTGTIASHFSAVEYSFLSFPIPSTIPPGFYSVQGLTDGQKTTRYWKKIEIK
jgi:hypothetical protein